MAEQHYQQKLSVFEKAGYSCADSAANFVFMTMVLFQLNFYTDVFGLTASAAAMILLWPRLWDAVADPIVGILADRTNTRWGKFRPWILFTTVPWFIVMILAYTTPHFGWSTAAMIAYACITNMMLMSIYSMNNMPYAALGGVMTGDVNERASLNSYRFVAVNAAQFIVGGFTLPLVAKFAASHASRGPDGLPLVGIADKQYGWQMTMVIWAVLCLVLFLITFVSTKERIKPMTELPVESKDPVEAKSKSNWRRAALGMFLVSGLLFWLPRHFLGIGFSIESSALSIGVWIVRLVSLLVFLRCIWGSLSHSIQQDFRDLVKNNPWKVMWCWTLVHFAILAFRGGALYNYYHHYADKPAMLDAVKHLGLVASAGATGNGILEWLGYIVHADMSKLAASNVADVFNSIVNMLNTGLTIIVILISPALARTFGKKLVAAAGFAGATVGTLVFYLLSPTNVWGMLGVTAFVSIAYAPTIALTWAIFADVADYSEWKVGRRFTGMVFATIGFALKSGLALGSAAFLWIMAGMFHYDTHGSAAFTLGDVNTIASISDASGLAAKLNSPTNGISTYIKEQLSPDTVSAMAAGNAAGSSTLEADLVRDMNKITADPALYDTNRFAGITLRTDTEDLLKKNNRTDHDTQVLNRFLLEEAYPSEICRTHNQTPDAKHGFRVSSGLLTGILFAICTVLLMCYPLNKHVTIQMADELAERRKKFAAQAGSNS